MAAAGRPRQAFVAPLSVAIGLAVALALLCAPVAAFAKSFTVDEVTIEAAVQTNGDLVASEARTLTFDGDFSRVFWIFSTVGTGGYEIVGVRQTAPIEREFVRVEDYSALDARPDGTYLVQDNGTEVEVDVFHRTSNDTATFVLEYRVIGAAKRFSDVAELYWQAIGDQWEVPTARASVRISPPVPLTKEEVRAWAHGPLTGVVSIADDGVVTLEVDDVPAGTFVEARVLYPESALSQAPTVGEAREAQILAEEAQWAEEANAQRRSARVTVAIWVGLPWVLALGALVLGVWAFFRHGREHRPQFEGQYFREDPRPDLHPAVIGALWRFGRVEDVDIAATLMDLADKGVIRMSPTTVDKTGIAGVFGGTEDTFVLERVKGTAADKATLLDRQLISLLFDTVAGGRDTVALTELPAYAKAHAETFSEQVKAWKSGASAQAEQLGFFEPESRAWQIGTFLGAVTVAAAGVFGAIQTGNLWPVLLPVPVAITLAVFGVFMNRRSRQGNELYRTYVAVRDFLRDFSRLQEAPPASVVLWNRFLVLAVIFGIADQVIEQLRVTLPDVVRDPAFQTSYWWVYAGAHGHSPVGVLSESFASAAQVATSQMSSASGGGGGFSGGGGGGFGGGGGGAD